MVRKAALIAGLLASVPATAQMQTNCATLGKQTNCTSIAAGADAQANANLAQQRLSAEGDRDNLMKKTGRLVAAGHCDGAVRVALESGDFSLAAAIRTYCAGK